MPERVTIPVGVFGVWKVRSTVVAKLFVATEEPADMDTLRMLLIGAVLGIPLVGCGLSWLEERWARRWMPHLALGLALAVLGGLLWLPAPADETPGTLMLANWLRLPGFVVAIGGRWDELMAALTLLTSIVLWLVASVWPEHRPIQPLMLSWLGVTLANVSGNLGQLFVGWTLSAWASSELIRPLACRAEGNRAAESRVFRPVWLMQRCSDTLLLAGFGLIWMHFGFSLETSAWTSSAIAALRPELVESIVLCLVVGVIGRCAQVPLTVWLETESGFAAKAGRSLAKLSEELVGVWNVPDGHHIAERLRRDRARYWHETAEHEAPATVWAWWLCAAFLPVGVGLLMRCEPLLVVATHTRLLMVVVGAFTLMMCSGAAAAQNNWARVFGQVAVAQCGLTLLTLGLNDPVGRTSALLLLVWQSVLIAACSMHSWARTPTAAARGAGEAVTLAVVCLATGLWGRHAVIDLIWSHTWPAAPVPQTIGMDSESMVLGTTESQVWTLVAVILCMAELLTSFAVLRAWFLQRRLERASAQVSSPSRWQITVAVWAMVLGGLVMGRLGPSAAWPPLFAVSPLLPLSATGAVLAWWLYSQPSSLPEKLATALGPFVRLARNRFYWDDLYFLVVVHPAVVIGEWLHAWDERRARRGVRSAWDRLAESLGESCEPLERGSPMIGALTAVSTVALLAWLLLWFRS